MADRIQNRRDTRENWEKFNPVLLEGEIGLVMDDPNLYKVGDGVNNWNNLPFRGFDGTLVHELGDSENSAMSQKGVNKYISMIIPNLISLSKGYYLNNDFLLLGYENSKISELLNIPTKDCIIKNVWKANSGYGIIFLSNSYKYVGHLVVESYIFEWKVDEVVVPEGAKYFIIQTQYANGVIIETTEQLSTGISFDVKEYIIENNKNVSLLKKDVDNILLRSNLFDKRNIIEGYFISSNNGSLNTTSPYSDYAISGLIPVKPNTKYFLHRERFPGDGSSSVTNEVRFISDNGVPLKPLNEDGSEFGIFQLSTKDGVMLSPNNAAYFQFTCKWKGVDCDYDNTYFIEGDKEIDKQYSILNPSFIPNYIRYKNINHNLIIKTSDEILADSFINTNGIGSLQKYSVSNIIKIEKGKEYKWTHPKALGENITFVEVDIVGNYIKAITPTVNEEKTIITYTPDRDMFIRVNLGYKDAYNDDPNKMYFSESEYFEENYQQGGYAFDEGCLLTKAQLDYVSNHKLIGKTIVFDGDSIGAGESNRPSWGKRILDKYVCKGKNYSIGGGTITSNLFTSSDVARHWISTSIDTIIEEYPQLDYLILEGGTNDADLDHEFELGTLDETNFTGPFDRNTFYGALDYIFQKVVTTYPEAKIGFIIAQKMGRTDYDSFTNRRKFFDYVIQACVKWGIPYLDLWNGCKLNPGIKTYWDEDLTKEENEAQGKYYVDGQHLTNKGYEFVTDLIEEWMKSL